MQEVQKSKLNPILLVFLLPTYLSPGKTKIAVFNLPEAKTYKKQNIRDRKKKKSDVTKSWVSQI